MNLRNRSLLILGLTFFVFFIIITAVSLSVTLSGLDRIEYQDMGDSMKQAQSALSAESSSLLSTAQDWARWDDMADFAVNHNMEFVERNANPDNMETIGIHLFMILDENGNLLYGRLLSPDFQTNTSVPENLLSLIQSDKRLVFHSETDPGISGPLLAPESPMIVASAPILHSDKSGPVFGTIIMGRYLEYGPLRRISEITGYNVGLYWPRKGDGQKIPQVVDEKLTRENNLVLVPENETVITGYSRIGDLSGRNLFLSVTVQRELYRIGFANIVTYLVLLALWAVMTGLIMVIVMDRTVLQRMGRLTDHVRSMGDGREKVPAPVLSGNDELAELEKTIIASRADLLLSEQRLRSFVSAMPGPAGLFTREGRILLANPAFNRVLKGPGEDVTGTLIQSYIQPAEFEKFERFVQEAVRTREVVQFENEAGGKIYLMSYYPVLDNNGEVIQLGFLAFDISERKRLENALQKLTKKIALLNTVIFSDIQNKVFVQTGYLELLKSRVTDPQLMSYIEKEEAVVREIQSSLRFARQYNEMGMSPPRWQNVMEVLLFAISHLDLGTMRRDFRLEGLVIYADSLLERVFITIIENAILHAKGATVIRAQYTITGEEAVIILEDDGVGIPEDRKEILFEKGIGSGGTGSLFLSREILSVTGIAITENGITGKGARFEIRVPKGSYRIEGK